jgi:very-short-patch-repair endonuclease
MDDALTRAELRATGMTGRGITDAVRTGRLVRLRNGHYATAAAGLPLQRAVRFGGRLGCVSELRSRRVWTLEPTSTHVHLAPNASRLRRVDGVVAHWHPLVDPASATRSHVGVVDALVCAAACLPRAEAVAAIDSALNLGLVTRSRLAQVTGKPVFAARLAEADGSAQSGLETFVRLLARDLGFRVAIQVRFAGIGDADLVIEDWVVIETDGSEFHDGAAPSARDRRRDALHAAAGRTALRFRYSQVVYELPTVAAAIIGAVGSHRRVQNSGRRASAARNRARRLGPA